MTLSSLKTFISRYCPNPLPLPPNNINKESSVLIFISRLINSNVSLSLLSRSLIYNFCIANNYFNKVQMFETNVIVVELRARGMEVKEVGERGTRGGTQYF